MTAFQENIIVAIVGGLISIGALAIIILRIKASKLKETMQEDLSDFYIPDVLKISGVEYHIEGIEGRETQYDGSNTGGDDQSVPAEES